MSDVIVITRVLPEGECDLCTGPRPLPVRYLVGDRGSCTDHLGRTCGEVEPHATGDDRMTPRPGDYVMLTRPATEPVAEVWRLRREHPSLVIHVDGGRVHCTEPEEKPDRRVHEWWSAEVGDVTVVRRAAYDLPRRDVEAKIEELHERLRAGVKPSVVVLLTAQIRALEWSIGVTGSFGETDL